MVFDNISDGDNTRAGKIVSGAIKGIAYAPLLSEVGWESLQTRLERRKIILFADILHANAAHYLQDDPPPPSIRPV